MLMPHGWYVHLDIKTLLLQAYSTANMDVTKWQSRVDTLLLCTSVCIFRDARSILMTTFHRSLRFYQQSAEIGLCWQPGTICCVYICGHINEWMQAHNRSQSLLTYFISFIIIKSSFEFFTTLGHSTLYGITHTLELTIMVEHNTVIITRTSAMCKKWPLQSSLWSSLLDM